MTYRTLRNAIAKFVAEDDATTAVEYAVMLALIVAVCIGSVNHLSNMTSQSFDKSGNAISGAVN